MTETTTPPELYGVATATLQTWLAAAQTALHQLSVGTAVVEATYGSGDGTRTVKYSQASVNGLRAYIRQLQIAIEPTSIKPRRAINIMFG